MTEKEKPIPIRIRIIREIELVLNRIGHRGIFVEKLVAEYMKKEGLSRRLIMECVDAVRFSGFAKFEMNDKKEKILKKKR